MYSSKLLVAILIAVSLHVSCAAEIKLELKAKSNNVLIGDVLQLEVHADINNLNETDIGIYCEGSKCHNVIGCEEHVACSVVTIGGSSQSAFANVTANQVGHVTLYVTASNTSSYKFDSKEAFVQISVGHSNALVIISSVVGWLYFAAWSISFYPQAVINFRRKSVVGLSFDFLGLNLTGFIFYATFNICLYAIPSFQVAYSQRFPRSIIPVELNDVFFAVHAVILTAVTVIQCFIYERGPQRLAYWAIGFLIVVWTIAVILLGMVLGHKFEQLDYIYYFSYAKLTITLIKYTPQAYLNFVRKSTDGWSIHNILLDFTGGTLSILQMLILSYNYDDWISIFGNVTKFGLGFLSILFDLVFIVQHYVLYRESSWGSGGDAAALTPESSDESTSGANSKQAIRAKGSKFGAEV